MLNKNVCPNCGQLYDTNLTKCPLCGTAPQVVETPDPVQRKRITEAERRQRRVDRRDAEQEARRRRKDARFMQDADEERQLEEEEARRKEEKRLRREEKRSARAASQETRQIPNSVVPSFTPGPARDGRGPMPPLAQERDRRRVPRVFLVLSAVVLAASLLVGGSYLLWKQDLVSLPFYDELAAKKDGGAAPVPSGSNGGDTAATTTEAPTLYRGEGAVPCTGITLGQRSIVFHAAGAQTQLAADPAPSDTTDERRFSSSDPSVVKVSPVGIVTAVGPGEAVLTVSCGEITETCAVLCDFAETAPPTLPPEITELVLNKNDMTFFAAGENYVLTVKNIPAGTPVEWRSLDESVATVDAGGHVVAVGNGTTRVFATVGNLETFCWVRCRFE